MNTENAIFPKGERTNPDYFTGTAWLNVLVQKDETGTYTIGNVTFEPSARTNWHTHAKGQILLVTEGKGWYQEKGRPAKKLQTGDVVVIPPDIEHWHGAAKTTGLTHIAITNNSAEGPVRWLVPVSDHEYDSVHTFNGWKKKHALIIFCSSYK